MRLKTILPFLLFVLTLFPFTSMASPYEVKEISILEIKSAITPATFDYLDFQFKKIPDGSLILIKINTPGGLITTTKDIITLIGSQTKPVAIWITPEGASASSAGAIIASSAHFILMSEGTNLGAATPVGLGEDIQQKDGRAKALNDLKAVVRSLSETRGRPAKPFEEMIESAKSFTDKEAVELKIADAIMRDLKAIKNNLDQKSFKILGVSYELSISDSVPSKIYPPSTGQMILEVLANPSTAYFLFLIGVALIYFEFQAPGGYIAGAIGVTFLILSAIAFQVLPLNWGALFLILTGLVLLVMEIYITSYGLLGLGGFASFTMGSLFLFHGESGFIAIDYPVLISTLLAVASSVGIVGWYLLREKRRQPKHEDFFLPLGSKGIVLSSLQDSHLYQIKVRGEIWKAESHSPLQTGDFVEVISIDREKLLAKIVKFNKE
jgi:membrane-bound serine protease (ClpP class)